MASQQQPRPMFRFASMIRPAAAPQPPTATAPQPMFRPPVATQLRPPTTTAPPPQTREPSPPQPPPSAPAPPPPAAPAPPPSQPQPQPVAQPPAAPAPLPSVPTVVAPPPSPRSPEPRRAATPSAPKSPTTRITSSVPPSPTPVVSYSSVPPSPKTERQDSTRPLQPYQAPKPAVSSRSPPPSPRNLEPEMRAPNQYSPKIKPISPLKLPLAAQIKSEAEAERRIPAEFDQKTVVVQQTTDRNKGIAQKFNGAQRYSTNETDWTGKREAMMTKDKGSTHHQKKQSDTEEPFGMSVLTLAGENKGAIMDLSPAPMKHSFNGSPRRLQKEWSDREQSGKESDEEGKSRMGKKNNNHKGMESLPMTAFMNSNVQGVNNSILHNASCTHHDPGVHLTFSRKGARYAKEAQRHKS